MTLEPAIFRGFTTLTRLWRLTGEMLGELGPSEENHYLQQINVLLREPVQAERLSETTRVALALDADEPSANR